MKLGNSNQNNIKKNIRKNYTNSKLLNNHFAKIKYNPRTKSFTPHRHDQIQLVI